MMTAAPWAGSKGRPTRRSSSRVFPVMALMVAWECSQPTVVWSKMPISSPAVEAGRVFDLQRAVFRASRGSELAAGLFGPGENGLFARALEGQIAVDAEGTVQNVCAGRNGDDAGLAVK